MSNTGIVKKSRSLGFYYYTEPMKSLKPDAAAELKKPCQFLNRNSACHVYALVLQINVYFLSPKWLNTFRSHNIISLPKDESLIVSRDQPKYCYLHKDERPASEPDLRTGYPEQLNIFDIVSCSLRFKTQNSMRRSKEARFLMQSNFHKKATCVCFPRVQHVFVFRESNAHCTTYSFMIWY